MIGIIWKLGSETIMGTEKDPPTLLRRGLVYQVAPNWMTARSTLGFCFIHSDDIVELKRSGIAEHRQLSHPAMLQDQLDLVFMQSQRRIPVPVLVRPDCITSISVWTRKISWWSHAEGIDLLSHMGGRVSRGGSDHMREKEGF